MPNSDLQCDAKARQITNFHYVNESNRFSIDIIHVHVHYFFCAVDKSDSTSAALIKRADAETLRQHLVYRPRGTQHHGCEVRNCVTWDFESADMNPLTGMAEFKKLPPVRDPSERRRKKDQENKKKEQGNE